MKRKLAVMMAMAMTAGLLAGCGSSSTGSTTAADSTAAQETTSAPETEAAPETTAAPETEAAADTEGEPVELTVFAAASMTETMNRIAELYK